MRNKDIKKLIKFHMESHIKDEVIKIDFPFETQIPKQKNFKFSFKHGLSLVTSVLMIFLVASFLFNQKSNTPIKFIETEQQVISYSMISSTSLLSHLTVVQELSYYLTSAQTPPIIRHVKPYLNMVEQLIADQSGLNIETGLSEDPNYTYFMSFETKDLLGGVNVYRMLYNMTLEDESDEESAYTIEGILIYKEHTFIVNGEKKIEDDETIIEFKAYKDSNNYITSSYKTESDEEIFEFEVVSFGQTLSEIKVEIEYDEEEIKIVLEFEEQNNYGTFEFEYFQEDGLNLLKIEFETMIDSIYTTGKMIVEVILDSTTQMTYYKIYVDPDDDDAYEFETSRDDDEDEEDEDEEDEDEEDEDEDDDEEDEDEDEEDEDA